MIAIGKAGYKAGRSLLDAVMSGMTEMEELHLLMIGLDEKNQSTITGLIEDYDRVHEQLYGQSPFFQSRVTAEVLSEEALDASLMEKCQTQEDKLLLSSLFVSERVLRRSVSGSMETAQAAWADLLLEPDSFEYFFSQLDGDSVVLIACSLCEPLGAAGAAMCLKYVKSRTDLPVGVLLTLPLLKSDRTDLAGNALRELSGIQADAMYVFGLPEDSRTETEGLEELVSLCLMDHFLRGGRGAYSFSMPLETPNWNMFGEASERFRTSMMDLLHMSCLMLIWYGPEITARLKESPGLLGARGWYGRLYTQLCAVPEEKAKEQDYMRALLHMLRFHMAWCYLVTGGLPLSLRYHAQLQDTIEMAKIHYDTVLEEAGKLALLSHDLMLSGIVDEQTVHRFSMDDTESERARRKITQQAEKVKELAEIMNSMEKTIGGRATLLILEEKAQSTLDEANELARQDEEAQQRIAYAAKLADAETMSKIDAAKSRLRNLQRHLAYLRGMAAYAERDLKEARKEENRIRKPQIQYTREEEPDIFFDRRIIKQMLHLYDKPGMDQKRAGRPLLEAVRSLPLLHVIQSFEAGNLSGTGTTGLVRSLYQAIRTENEGR